MPLGSAKECSVLNRVGVCMLKTGRPQTAKAIFRDLARNFPQCYRYCHESKAISWVVAQGLGGSSNDVFMIWGLTKSRCSVDHHSRFQYLSFRFLLLYFQQSDAQLGEGMQCL